MVPDVSSAKDFLDATDSTMNVEGLCALLQRILPSNFQAFFIIDGMDECDDSEKDILIRQLRNFKKRFVLLMCVSLRWETTSGFSLEWFENNSLMTIPDDNPEIEAFISAELISSVESGKLLIGEPAIILEIQNALIKGSQGMFLWVALQIKSLYLEKTDEDIRKALVDLPESLSKTFTRILRRYQVQGDSYQKRILELVSVASRSLTTEELREALSVVPGDTTWNPAWVPYEMYSTLALCGSLVTVDEEELTVRLIHHSVVTFLHSGSIESVGIPFTEDNANNRMAATLVTYLSYGVFDTQLSTARVSRMMAASVPSRIILPTLGSAGNTKETALKLLLSKRNPSIDVGKALSSTSKHFKVSSACDFHFYHYAKDFWFHHTWSIPEGDVMIYNLFLELLDRRVVSINLTDACGRTTLWWAARHGNVAAVRLILHLRYHTIDVNTKDQFGSAPLSVASRGGHKAVVHLLIGHGNIDLNISDQLGRTTLWQAADGGDCKTVEALLHCGGEKLDINLRDIYGRTPLSRAAGNGHLAVVDLLLKHRLINVNWPYNHTPLMLATLCERETVVELLLKSDHIDINIMDSKCRTPLW
jgi:ankyrin repeat protein